MPIQSYEEVQSLLSGDVPAVVYKEARDEVEDFAELLRVIQAEGIDGAAARRVVDRVKRYINPPLDAQSFAINEAKSDVPWSWNSVRFNNDFPIVLAAGQQVDASLAAQAATKMRGDNEYAGLMMTATGRVAAQIQSPAIRRKLSNIPISANLMFGNAQLPALLAQSLISLPSTTWTCVLRDLSNAANTVSPVAFGRRYLDDDAKRIEQVRRALLFANFMSPYLIGPLSGQVTTAGAGSTGAVAGGSEVTLRAGQTMTLRYDTGGADFIWYWNLDDSTQSDGAEPAMTCQILLGDVATPLMDVAISARDFVFAPTVAVTGMKQIAGVTGGIAAASLPSPGAGWTMLVRKGTKIQVVLNNTNSIASNLTITVRNALGGIALYSPADLKGLIAQGEDCR